MNDGKNTNKFYILAGIALACLFLFTIFQVSSSESEKPDSDSKDSDNNENANGDNNNYFDNNADNLFSGFIGKGGLPPKDKSNNGTGGFFRKIGEFMNKFSGSIASILQFVMGSRVIKWITGLFSNWRNLKNIGTIFIPFINWFTNIGTKIVAFFTDLFGSRKVNGFTL